MNCEVFHLNLHLNIQLRRRRRQQIRRRITIMRRTLRDSIDPFEVSEKRFIELYLLPKGVCRSFYQEISERFFITERITALPPMMRFLCALRFFASGSFQRSVGQDFMTCVSQTSVSRCVNEVANILNEITSQYITFPNEIEQSSIKQDFYRIASFPGIIGLIDGTHVKICAPKSEIEQVYYCRKGGHSLNVLLICDSKYQIRYINAKFPGTSHDAYVWRRSLMLEHFKQFYERGRRNFWILGDSGFPLQPWLMTPVANSGSNAECNYNTAHKTTRCMVERCIGIFKSRFRCLSKERVLCYDPTKAGRIVNACAVLHNLLVKTNTELPEFLEIESNDDEHNASGYLEDNSFLSQGRMTRQTIINNSFNVN